MVPHLSTRAGPSDDLHDDCELDRGVLRSHQHISRDAWRTMHGKHCDRSRAGDSARSKGTEECMRAGSASHHAAWARLARRSSADGKGPMLRRGRRTAQGGFRPCTRIARKGMQQRRDAGPRHVAMDLDMTHISCCFGTPRRSI